MTDTDKLVEELRFYLATSGVTAEELKETLNWAVENLKDLPSNNEESFRKISQLLTLSRIMYAGS